MFAEADGGCLAGQSLFCAALIAAEQAPEQDCEEDAECEDYGCSDQDPCLYFRQRLQLLGRVDAMAVGKGDDCRLHLFENGIDFVFVDEIGGLFILCIHSGEHPFDRGEVLFVLYQDFGDVFAVRRVAEAGGLAQSPDDFGTCFLVAGADFFTGFEAVFPFEGFFGADCVADAFVDVALGGGMTDGDAHPVCGCCAP